MTLPDIVQLCDAVELAAILHQKALFGNDVSKQFFPGQAPPESEGDLKDLFGLFEDRATSAASGYPFVVTDHSILFQPPTEFNSYCFQLLGRSLEFGGPPNCDALLREFRHFFEDVVRWCLRKAGFASEILSEPRQARGLHIQLAAALRELSDRFREAAVLRDDRLLPHDNDLDVDVFAVPILGNASRGGWPTFQIQCATGNVRDLELKLAEGSNTFTTVWEKGFFAGSRIRAVATPDDLLKLHDVHWLRLGQAGWVLDRTRLSYLSSTDKAVDVPDDLAEYWARLWAVRKEISLPTGAR